LITQKTCIEIAGLQSGGHWVCTFTCPMTASGNCRSWSSSSRSFTQRSCTQHHHPHTGEINSAAQLGSWPWPKLCYGWAPLATLWPEHTWDCTSNMRLFEQLWDCTSTPSGLSSGCNSSSHDTRSLNGRNGGALQLWEELEQQWKLLVERVNVTWSFWMSFPTWTGDWTWPWWQECGS